MPTTPSADPTQKALLLDLKTLAQTDAATTGNQIAMLNEQIAKYQHGQVLFQERYDYWDTYISKYMAERVFLDGQHQVTPLVTADYTQFLSQTGRLFDTTASAPARFTPKRIPEFDGLGLTHVASNDEAVSLANETSGRSDLLNGFTNAFTSGFSTNSVLTPSSTTLQIQRSTASTPQTGVRVVVNGGSTAAVILINSTSASSGTGPFLYTLGITVQTPTFSSIPINAGMTGTLLAFTNTERTNKIATSPSLQAVLNGLISTYSGYMTGWKNILQGQRTAILANTTEDAPDTAYIANQLAALNQVSAYFPGVLVTNAALASNAALNATRTTAMPARVTAIYSRITTVGGFDSRYTYSDRLYNLTDGSITTVTILTKQRDALAAQQGTSNARAAKFAAESF